MQVMLEANQISFILNCVADQSNRRDLSETKRITLQSSPA